MEGKQAKVLISISEGRIEFEGSEDFVERQLVNFGDLIKQSLAAPPAKKKPPAGQKPDDADAAEPPLSEGLKAYEHLFAEADGKIQILKDIPGANKAQKTVNAARLLALANSLLGKKTTSFEDIKATCKAHSCLDDTNFSSTLKAEKEHFIPGGSRGAQTLSLTVPGRKAADKLAADLNK
jgi:hypothetical protein